MASLHDADGRVAVTGFYDGVRPPDPAILRTIEAVGFDAGRYFAEIGARSPDPLPSGAELLRRQWLEPTLELNGLSGGYGGPGTKTVIPARAAAKVTCRLVAGQDPERVFEAIRAASASSAARPASGSRSRAMDRGSAAAALPPDLPALGVVEDVLEGLYGVRPLRVAMGATIPIGGAFRRILGIETVFFSFSTADEDFHGPNEFFRLKSFRDGLVAWARVLEAIGAHLPGLRRYQEKPPFWSQQ